MFHYRQANRRRGVTLLEAVMVVILLGSSAVASSFLMNNQWSAKREVIGTTGNVARIIEDARETAIVSQANVRVAYAKSGSETKVEITRQAGPLAPEKFWQVTIASDLTLAGRPNAIVFAANGSADAGLRWTITQQRSVGSIEVEPATGTVIAHKP